MNTFKNLHEAAVARLRGYYWYASCLATSYQPFLYRLSVALSPLSPPLFIPLKIIEKRGVRG